MRRTESPEVIYAGGGIVSVDAAAIAQLKQDATGNARQRIRLCTHPTVDDLLHEMLIVHEKNVYVRPHKHLGKSESFHVIEGDVDVVIFDDAGSVAQMIRMGAYGSGRHFYYRLAEPLFHTLLIRSAVLVFHEVTNGPFRREGTVFAPWAPVDTDEDGVRRFLLDLDAVVSESW